ncbi:MAG TPA: hypothetical protein VFV50_06830 [Bdellovibrionales bacterium]|nr:hypothetical protein [Bdellovibrionales bacterium]
MEAKVKISKDGKSINFAQSEQLPASPKKFRQSPELEGFYRFLHEHDLRKEAAEIIDRILFTRKAAKSAAKKRGNA